MKRRKIVGLVIVGALVLGMASCGNEEEVVVEQEETKVEQQVVPQEPQIEEEVPKEEPKVEEEIIPQEPQIEEEVPQSNIEDVNAIVEFMLSESMGYGYSVGLEVNGNQVDINVVASDVNVGGLSRQQIDELVAQANLDISQDSLAQSVKTVYAQQGYGNMTIKIVSYDVNGTVLYRAYA